MKTFKYCIKRRVEGLIEEIPLSSIECHQTRAIPDEDLVYSLSKFGQLGPIRVRPNRWKNNGSFEIVYGHRRVAAARKLGWKTILSIVTEDSDLDVLVLSLVENIDRKDLSDYEKAQLLDRIHVQSGKTYLEIAEIIGRSPSFVSQHVAMLRLFPDSIASEEERIRVLSALTENHARVLARISDPLERWNTAKFALHANLGVRELQKFCLRVSERIANKTLLKKSVQEIIRSLVESLNSKNLARFFGPVDPKSFTMFSRFPPFGKMDAEMAKQHLDIVFRQIDKLNLRLEDLDVRNFGNFGYATVSIIQEFLVSGKAVRTRTRGTLVLVKEDSNWSIVHEHWSAANPDEFGKLIAEGSTMRQTELIRKSRKSYPSRYE